MIRSEPIMANTDLSANGRRFIHELEGCCLKFYGDPKGYPTVGYGHLITDKVTYRKKYNWESK